MPESANVGHRVFDAQDIADYFLNHQISNHQITNLKLQKLLYYAQAIALVVLERPLFMDNVEHWEHGPVVEAMYHRYGQYSNQPLPIPIDSEARLDRSTIRFLSKINQFYGVHSAIKLLQMTHEEDPWKNTQDRQVITMQSMRKYFQERDETYERFATFTPEEARDLARTPEVMQGIRAGLEDRQAGRMIPWEDIRGALGLN